MTRIARGLAAVVLLFAGLTVVWSGSAAAQPPPGPAQTLEGFYNYVEEGLPPVTWRLSPTCIPLYCYLHVTSTTNEQVTFAQRNLNFAETAQPLDGRWNMFHPSFAGMQCADGTAAPTQNTFIFDPVTLAGTHTITYNAVCGLQPNMIKKPFNLSWQGPLPSPVTDYPLYCTSLQWCPN